MMLFLICCHALCRFCENERNCFWKSYSCPSCVWACSTLNADHAPSELFPCQHAGENPLRGAPLMRHPPAWWPSPLPCPHPQQCPLGLRVQGWSQGSTSSAGRAKRCWWQPPPSWTDARCYEGWSKCRCAVVGCGHSGCLPGGAGSAWRPQPTSHTETIIITNVGTRSMPKLWWL